MTITPAVGLGPYDILAPLGRGGIREVWRAREARLDCHLAIRSLSDLLSNSPVLLTDAAVDKP